MACEILSSTMTMATSSPSMAVAGCAAAPGAGAGRCGVSNGSFSARKTLTFRTAPSGLGRLSNDGKIGRLDGIRQRSTSIGAIAAPSTSPSTCEGQSFFAALANAEPTCSTQSESANDGHVLESWLETSLSDIVRHLPEAPFLQYVKPHRSTHLGVRQRVPEELFGKPENWGPVKQDLQESAPEGIILVHRLDQESLGDCCMTGSCNGANNSGEGFRVSSQLQPGGFSTDVWGLLVHGCRGQCNACYILKTTRVASPSGILTHFCVSRAKCFGPSLKSQLQSPWLL